MLLKLLLRVFERTVSQIEQHPNSCQYPLINLPFDIARRAQKRQMAREAVEKIANQYFPAGNQNLQTGTTIKSSSKSEFVNLAFETEEEVMPRTRSINNVE